MKSNRIWGKEMDRDMNEREEQAIETQESAVREESMSGEEGAEISEKEEQPKTLTGEEAKTAGQEAEKKIEEKKEEESEEKEKPESDDHKEAAEEEKADGEESNSSQEEEKPESGAEEKKEETSAEPEEEIASLPAVEEEAADSEGGKNRKALKAACIVAAMLAVTAGGAYGAVSYYYSDRFFEGTTINGLDCSGLTAFQVEEKLAQKIEQYSIEVKSRDQEPQVIDGGAIDYRYVPDGSVRKLLTEQYPLAWMKGYFEESAYTASNDIAYSRVELKEQLTQLECAKPENQEAPEDAYVAFGKEQFEIVPETAGSVLNAKKAFHVLEEAVSASAREVDLDQEENYATAAVKKDDPALAATLADCNLYANASVTYTFGSESVVLDGKTIKDWLTFDDKKQLVKDDAALSQHVKEYVAQLAADYDTIGKERNFHTTSGRDVIVGGGNYGWQINQEEEAAVLLEQIKTGQQVTREPVYSITGCTPGKDDIGNTYIEVDLSNQTMYFYRDGALLLESSLVSGNMSYSNRATPSGIFHMYYKQRNQVLRGRARPEGGYEYEQPVSYWMPFNGGIGFHDANWRYEFGGSIYLGSGSHGCINMPPQKAAELYELIDTVIPIVVFY